MNTYLYEYGGKLYINLTNQCSNACVFCIRNSSDGVGGNKLWLSETPSYSQVIELLKARYNAVCRCAFGEAGFYSMLEFAGECVSALNRVVLSVVDTVGKEEIRRCAEIAQGIGAEFRVRAYDS